MLLLLVLGGGELLYDAKTLQFKWINSTNTRQHLFVIRKVTYTFSRNFATLFVDWFGKKNMFVLTLVYVCWPRDFSVEICRIEMLRGELHWDKSCKNYCMRHKQKIRIQSIESWNGRAEKLGSASFSWRLVVVQLVKDRKETQWCLVTHVYVVKHQGMTNSLWHKSSWYLDSKHMPSWSH